MITKDLVDSVKSRAGVLARRYYFLEKEDMLQEGYIFLMSLDTTNLNNRQKHKAINNMFANMERHARYRQKIEKNISSFDTEVDSVDYAESPEEVMEREQITNQLMKKLNTQEVLLIEWLSNGWSLDKIASVMGLTRDRVRRLIAMIITKRKELEAC